MKIEENIAGGRYLLSYRRTDLDETETSLAYEDEMDPEVLCVGRDHRLDKESVISLIHALEYWVDTKRLPPKDWGMLV